MYIQSEKLEFFNKELENINNKTEMKNTITERKNTGRNQQQTKLYTRKISEMVDSIVELTPTEQKNK